MVETVYEETSTALLEVLQQRYKFLDHLQVIPSSFFYFAEKIETKQT